MVGWFEIPVKDMERAKTFYENVFQVELKLVDFGGLKMGWFPYVEDGKGTPGTLIEHAQYKPSSTDGVLIYFTSIDVNNEVSRIEIYGGKILQPKTQISPEHGYMALF